MDDLEAHGARTAWLAARLARRLGLRSSMVRDVEDAARTHDIGKTYVAQAVLDKPGRLDKRERRHVEMHAVYGAWQLMSQQDPQRQGPGLAVQVALLHHEWWNGLGYPFGLSGAEIPLAARIVSVADVFDALVSARPYKPAWSLREVLRYLARQRDRQFDPTCVSAMLEEAPLLPVQWRSIAQAEGQASPPQPQSAPLLPLQAAPWASRWSGVAAA